MDLSKFSFVYNAAAHFKTVEKYPDGLIAAISSEGMAGFDALCWALEELSIQGELVRRDMGYDKQETLKAEHVRANIKLREVILAKQIILQAVIKGLSSEEDESQEVDEVLAELEKKTGTS